MQQVGYMFFSYHTQNKIMDNYINGKIKRPKATFRRSARPCALYHSFIAIHFVHNLPLTLSCIEQHYG